MLREPLKSWSFNVHKISTYSQFGHLNHDVFLFVVVIKNQQISAK